MKYIIDWIVGFLMITALCALDSLSWWPTIIFVVCWGYFLAVAYKRDWFYDPEMEDEE